MLEERQFDRFGKIAKGSFKLGNCGNSVLVMVWILLIPL
jgi:hypothetical protein